MKFALAIVLVSCFTASLALPNFHSFKAAHGKSYLTPKEHEYRMKVFSDNVRKIEKHNAEARRGLHSFTMAINQFADLTEEEFSQTLGFTPTPLVGVPKHNSSIPIRNLADSVNWVDQGYVTSVKDQRSCGSCWAFSAAGALEGAFFKKGMDLVSLSPQMFVDCDQISSGCNGGTMESAFYYTKKHGVMTEADYPYKGYDSYCKFDENSIVDKVSGYESVAENEPALQAALAEVGPISVAINADPIQFYSSGVLTRCASGQMNHAVLLVGYGTEGGEDYWLIKNSWGKSWGEDGYFKLGRNMGKLCHISDWASYPVA